MELNTVLERVRKLVAIAEHPGTGVEEANAARQMADSLMLKYAIEQAELDASRPAPQRAKPGIIDIDLTPDYDLVGYVAQLAASCARTCRCKIRQYTKWTNEAGYRSTVYGFESDLRYFEVLYTTLRLHMIGALRPKVDPARSLEDNAYELHKAGLNWLEIAGEYGWKKARDIQPEDTQPVMYVNAKLGERKSNWTVGSHYKRACQRACKARGEKVLSIPASASETFRRSAAQGYVARMRGRLSKLESGREAGTGAELVLANAANDLNAFFKEQNPDMFKEAEDVPECPNCKKAKSGHCRAHPAMRFREQAFSDAGYSAGVRQANSADLGGNVGTAEKRQIG